MSQSNVKQAQPVNTMQGVAAAASIAQEPVTEQVIFAVTGDPETDLIAAIVACAQRLMAEPHPAPTSPRVGQRVCEYLAGRFKAEADKVEAQQAKMQEAMERMQQRAKEQQAALGTYGSPTAPTYNPIAPGSGYYTTSSGTIPQLTPMQVFQQQQDEWRKLSGTPAPNYNSNPETWVCPECKDSPLNPPNCDGGK